MSSLIFTIAGTNRSIKVDSFNLPDRIEERSKLTAIIDTDLSVTFEFGQRVSVTDSVQGLLFAGIVNTDDYERLHPNDILRHELEFIDLTFDVDRLTSNEQYTQQYAGVIAADQHAKHLAAEGITAAYALRIDDTQSDFNAGTLANTVATSDGNLELAKAGSDVTVVGAGAGFSLGNGLMFTGYCASGYSSAYVYRQIWSGSQVITSATDYLQYDLWISSDSPEIKASIEVICSDGTTLSSTTQTDQQGFTAAVSNDLSGLANDTWFTRLFGFPGGLNGKTITGIYLGIGGARQGTYTAYFRNVGYYTFGGGFQFWFFGPATTLSANIQAANVGYSNVSLAQVSVEDKSATVTHASLSIGSAGIVKDSSMTYTSLIPDGCTGICETSIDGGASWQEHMSGDSIPNLLAGMSVSGRNVQYRHKMTIGKDPTVTLGFGGPTLTVNSAYNASKSDSITTYTTTSDFNSGTLTDTKTVGSNGITTNGIQRVWDDANYSSQTLSGAGSGSQFLLNKQFCVQATAGSVPISRFDFAGQWANPVAEIDISVDATGNYRNSFFYRTTGFSSNDNAAYIVEVTTTTIGLYRGTNTTGAGTYTGIGGLVTIGLTAGSIHRLKIVAAGSSHKIYLDGVLLISQTDSTFLSAGYFGVRNHNVSGSTQTAYYDNFGVCSALSGTWESPSIDISGPGTYGTSVLMWDTDGIPNGCDVSALTSIDGGSTWQTGTNGGAIVGLTPGQSLAGVHLLIKMELDASNADVVPVLNGVSAWIMGAYSTSGTRISPALSLTNAGRVGDTLVSWNADTPAGTSLAIATSPTGSGSWTNRSSGDPIAGVTSQPDLVLDTFNTNTSASYTQYNLGSGTSGFVYDTTNSRIAASGSSGSNNTLFRYDGVSFTDGYVEADLDEVYNSGLACRITATNSCYLLYLFDSAVGNSFFLFSVINNTTYTQIATGSLSFVRGTYRKVRLSCVGTTIAILMDGVQLASVTNSAVAGPGKAGLLANQLLRCYNLRIQGYGDNLTGVNSYTRATLTTTDPTQTPVLQTLTLAALGPDIDIGALMPAPDYRNVSVNKVFDDLSSASDDWLWFVRPNASLVARARQADPSPWILTGNDTMITDGPHAKNNGDNYRNRQIITNVDDGNGGTITVIRNNTGGFPGTISQSDFATLTGGGSGIVANVADGTGMSIAQAQVFGDGLLQEFGTIGRTVTFKTERTGLKSGQYLSAIVPQMLLNDAALLITNVQMTYRTSIDHTMQYVVEACEGPNVGSWAKQVESSLR